MRIPSIMQRKKLRAATARRQRTPGMPDEMDYEQMSEPNMKLSRALLIVLMLHVVAVAGIVAFNTIKTRQVAGPPIAAETIAPVASVAPVAVAPIASSPAKTTEGRPPARPKSNIPDGTEPVPPEAAVADSGKTYVVVKGDNPVTIAHKLHVSYDALLSLNAIQDPRKLQIGQKLRLPEPVVKPKHKTD